MTCYTHKLTYTYMYMHATFLSTTMIPTQLSPNADVATAHRRTTATATGTASCPAQLLSRTPPCPARPTS